MHDAMTFAPSFPRVPVTVLPSPVNDAMQALSASSGERPASSRVVLIHQSTSTGNAHDNPMSESRSSDAAHAGAGCVCCTLHGDPVHLLAELAQRRRSGTLVFDEVVIRPSCPGDLAELVRRLADATHLRSLYALDEHSLRSRTGYRRDPDPARSAAGSAVQALMTRLRTSHGRGAEPSGIPSAEPRSEPLQPAQEEEIGSFIFHASSAFHFERLGKFMASVLQVYGNDMLRYKGTLHFDGCSHRVILWGNRMLMGSEAGAAWQDGESRQSCMIIVGRRLPRELLQQGLEQCLIDALPAWRP